MSAGFFAATLGMRSVQFVTIAMVPTLAFYIFGRYLIRQPRRPGYRDDARWVPHAELADQAAR